MNWRAKMKKIISMFLIISMMLPAFAAPAYAAEPAEEGAEGEVYSEAVEGEPASEVEETEKPEGSSVEETEKPDESAVEVPDIVTKGLCGEELTWEFVDDILYIKGKGKMLDYDRERRPEWDALADRIKELHIEKEITLLDGDAFVALSKIESIHFNGSEADWKELEYQGEKEREEVFQHVKEYYFEGQNDAEADAEDNEEIITEGTTPNDIKEGDSNQEISEEQNNSIESDSSNNEKNGTVANGLAIIVEPEDVSAVIGERVEFRVEANTEEVTYQWQWSKDQITWKNCTSTGCNTNTFGFSMKETLNNRYYRCVVSDSSDSVNSYAAKVTLADTEPIEITVQPSSIEAAVGDNAELHIEVNKEDASYLWQWSEDGVTWVDCTSSGYNTDTLSFVMEETFNGRVFHCMITSDGVTVISDEATITLADQKEIEITIQPESVEAAVGENVTLHVVVNKEDASYQWQWSKDGVTWRNCTSSGSNTDTFGFIMKEALIGRTYRCVISSGNNEVASDGVVISLAEQEEMEITAQPDSVEAAAGENVSLHVEVNKEDASYQWQWSKDGVTWRNCTSSGSNTDTFGFVMKEALNGRTYRCVITSGNNEITSDGAVITLKVPEEVPEEIEITAQPESVEAAVGENVTLHVEVNKEDASYQWQWSKDGVAWRNCTSSGAYTDTFGFVMKEALNNRLYRCVITSGTSSITSENATITIKAEGIEIDGVIYELIDNKMTVTDYTGTSDTVVIQETVNDYTVTVIGESAFEGSTISEIDLPDTIETIEKRAFANCSNLSKMN